MEYTQNYALRKPGLNEYANVGDLNFNADKIDSQMKKNQDVDGEVYDPTTTSSNAYEAGDYVINPDDGLMYVCNGTTYGTWDATKWDHTTEFEELQKAMASGGESELADLHDVDITNPTDGQALLYDPTSSKWHNSDLPDADVTKEASGNPIEFNDGADAPLVKCTTTIQGYQEGSGTPSPDNIRPITAYTEGEIEVRGKNIADPSVYKQDYVLASDGSENSAVNYCITNRVRVDANTVYTCSLTLKPGGTDILRLGFYDEDMNFISRPTVRNKAFTTPVNAYWLRLSYDNLAPDLTNIMIVKGSVSYAYEPYTSTTHTTTYPSAIYRGSEDCVEGEVTSEWVVVDMSTWTSWSTVTYGGKTIVRRALTDIKVSGHTEDFICSHLSRRDDGESTFINGTMRNYTSNYYNLEIFVDGVTSEAEMNAWTLAQKNNGTPVLFAYRLATPTTSSVTPTNLPIKSLSGYNHIESSTGEMEVEYFPQKEQPLIDLIPEASNMHTYSTAEHAVGTWIDGETIYEQTYTYSGTGAANPFQTTIDMTGKNLIEVIQHYARYTYNSGESYGECVGAELIYSNCNTLNVRYVDSVPYTLTVSSFLGNATESYDIAFTLRYTKTSSNNRSLAKSAPQEEQVEELKEEPTEETKEEVKEEPEEPVEEVKEVKEEETKDPETNEEAKR